MIKCDVFVYQIQHQIVCGKWRESDMGKLKTGKKRVHFWNNGKISMNSLSRGYIGEGG